MLPNALAWEEAVDLDSLRTWEILSRCTHSFNLPAKTVRELIDNLNLKSWAVEEVQLLKEEMVSVIDFYCEEHRYLQQIMEENQVTESLYSQGCITLLKH